VPAVQLGKLAPQRGEFALEAGALGRERAQRPAGGDRVGVVDELARPPLRADRPGIALQRRRIALAQRIGDFGQQRASHRATRRQVAQPSNALGDRGEVGRHEVEARSRSSITAMGRPAELRSTA